MSACWFSVVTLPSSLKPFVENSAERFAQAVNQGDGRGVMIEPLLAPIAHGWREVEVPTAHRLLACVHNIFHARAHGDRRHSGRGAEGLLGSAEADVYSLSVNIQGNAGEGGDGIDDEQCAEFVGYFAIVLDALNDAGGGFAVGEADKFDFPALASAKNVRRIDGATVGRLHAVTLAGMRSAMMAMRSENAPFTHTMHSSPVSSGFMTAASIPPEPEAEIGKVMRFWVRKTWRKSIWTSSIMPVNHGSIWPTSGAAIARYTRGSTQEGPGVSISCSGGRSSPMISSSITHDD